MSGFLFYEEQAGDKLKLVAEVDDFDSVELALDELVEQEPKLSGREFVVFPSEARMTVEAGEEVIQPRRKITIRGGSGGASKPAQRRSTSRSSSRSSGGSSRKAPSKPAPKPSTRKSSASKPASKPAAKTTRKPAARKPAAKAKAKSGGSPFKRNAKGDD